MEQTVNSQIAAKLGVRDELLSPDEAGARYSLERLPEGAESVRIVHIGDYDACPCIGSHVTNTAEIPPVSIISSDCTDGGCCVSALNSVKTEHIGHIPDPKRRPAGLAAAGRSGTGRVQCYQTPPFGRIPADKKPGGNRERTRTTERRPDYKARTGQIHPTTAEQAFSRDQPADLDLFAGRYCQKQRLEPLQTAARGRSGAARLSPNGTLGRRYENIHGQQRDSSTRKSFPQSTPPTAKRRSLYHARQGEPFRIGTIRYDFRDRFVKAIILSDTANTLLHTGNIFDANVLDNERARITNFLKTRVTTTSRSTTSAMSRIRPWAAGAST